MNPSISNKLLLAESVTNPTCPTRSQSFGAQGLDPERIKVRFGAIFLVFGVEQILEGMNPGFMSPFLGTKISPCFGAYHDDNPF